MGDGAYDTPGVNRETVWLGLRSPPSAVVPCGLVTSCAPVAETLVGAMCDER